MLKDAHSPVRRKGQLHPSLLSLSLSHPYLQLPITAISSPSASSPSSRPHPSFLCLFVSSGRLNCPTHRFLSQLNPDGMRNNIDVVKVTAMSTRTTGYESLLKEAGKKKRHKIQNTKLRSFVLIYHPMFCGWFLEFKRGSKGHM